MSEFQPLIDQLFREEVEAARRMGPEGRMRHAMRMMEENFQWARALGDVERDRRAAIARSLKDHRHYGPPVARL